MAKANYLSRVTLGSLKQRVHTLTSIARYSKRQPPDATGKLLAVIKVPDNSPEAKNIVKQYSTKSNVINIPSAKELEQEDLKKRMQKLKDESRVLKLTLTKLKQELKDSGKK